MEITVDNKEYFIRWNHSNPMVIDPDDKERCIIFREPNKFYGTTCEIIEKRDGGDTVVLLASGKAYLSISDNHKFNRNEGRRRSLKRALQECLGHTNDGQRITVPVSFDSKQRKQIWDQYLAKFGIRRKDRLQKVAEEIKTTR